MGRMATTRGFGMRRFLFALGVLGALSSATRAGVVAVGNFTPDEITFTVAEPDQKPRTVTLAPTQVLPVRVTGPADITFPTPPKDTTLRIDPYNAYVFLPDDKAGRRLEGIELPGNPPERDARAELNPPPAEPVKIPVTLLVDDADPRADGLWQKLLHARFDEAAAAIEAAAGVKLEFAGFDTWKSDPTLRDVPGLLADFEAKVRVKPGRLVIGYTSRRVDEKEKEPAPFGACRGFSTNHILLREWRPRDEARKVEVMVHHLGLALGATLTPDLGSVMRPGVGADALGLHPKYRMRFDPLNVLAMNLWADELRRGPVAKPGDVVPPNKTRLTRVYKALLRARPGDSLALTYLNEFDRGGDIARAPDPANPKPADPVAKNDPVVNRTVRDEIARAVVRAVVVRAKANSGRDAITGDELTAAYVRVAADAALTASGADADARASGFLLGIGVALDDAESLRNDSLTEAAAKAIETDGERDERISLLGNPTLRGRRDLCRRFAVGCAAGELLPTNRAEEVAVNRSLSLKAVQRPAGFGFPPLAAEFAGIAFACSLRENPDALNKLAGKVHFPSLLPDAAGLRDGLSLEVFEDDYGDASDDRFQRVLTDIRGRVRKLRP